MINRQARVTMIYASVSVIVAIGVAVFVWLVYDLVQGGRGKATTARIQTVSVILISEKPESVESQALAHLVRKYNQEASLTDAWGRPLVVERSVDHDGAPHYLVKSLGRDGREGNCCIGIMEGDRDADLVALDGEWLQVWR